MDLEDITLSEVRQTQKCVIPLIENVRNGHHHRQEADCWLLGAQGGWK